MRPNAPADFQPTHHHPGGVKLATYDGVPIGPRLDMRLPRENFCMTRPRLDAHLATCHQLADGSGVPLQTAVEVGVAPEFRQG